MGNTVDAFFRVSFEEFHFLVIEFGCKKTVKKEPGVSRIIYRNKTTAVEIGLEWREQYIYVDLYRLVNGKMKENPIMILPDSDLTVFNLEDLLAVRAPELELSANPSGRPLSNNDVEKTLSDRAVALREYGRDVLQGDFSIFRDLHTVVKSRVLAHQPSDRAVVHRATGAQASKVTSGTDELGNLRLLLLAYALNHAYRIASLEEIAHAIPHARRDEVRQALNHLANEGLVTRVSGRYCFNKAIPAEIGYNIERLAPPKGTIRKRAN